MSQIKRPATVPKLKEGIWVEYAATRVNKLRKTWSNFLTTINCSHVSSKPLLAELVNEQVFEDLITNMFRTYSTPSLQCIKPTIKSSKEEENVIRYASGYIARKFH